MRFPGRDATTYSDKFDLNHEHGFDLVIHTSSFQEQNVGMEWVTWHLNQKWEESPFRKTGLSEGGIWEEKSESRKGRGRKKENSGLLHFFFLGGKLDIPQSTISSHPLIHVSTPRSETPKVSPLNSPTSCAKNYERKGNPFMALWHIFFVNMSLIRLRVMDC